MVPACGFFVIAYLPGFEVLSELRNAQGYWADRNSACFRHQMLDHKALVVPCFTLGQAAVGEPAIDADHVLVSVVATLLPVGDPLGELCLFFAAFEALGQAADLSAQANSIISMAVVIVAAILLPPWWFGGKYRKRLL